MTFLINRPSKVLFTEKARLGQFKVGINYDYEQSYLNSRSLDMILNNHKNEL